MSGDDLLSRGLSQSTIGATELNVRVRDGIVCDLRAIATRQEKVRRVDLYILFVCGVTNLINDVSNQANRVISTAQLHVLPRFHMPPIDVVVFHGSQARSCFEGGFPLRCFQRLSCPNVATLQCRWRDNRSTRGSSTPVLSY